MTVRPQTRPANDHKAGSAAYHELYPSGSQTQRKAFIQPLVPLLRTPQAATKPKQRSLDSIVEREKDNSTFLSRNMSTRDEKLS
jgi:hypothetical protein